MSITEITEAINPIEKTQKINEIIRIVNGIQVNNSTVTFTQGGVTKGTLTTNQASNSTIELDSGGSSITVDNALSITSTNPVQNKVITASLNNKVSMTSMKEVKVVIDSYSNGSSWYRKYSDGWCEQGGTVQTGAVTSYPISLLVEMRDTNYTALISNMYLGDDTGGVADQFLIAGASSYGKSPTTLRVSTTSGANYALNWQVSGYMY